MGGTRWGGRFLSSLADFLYRVLVAQASVHPSSAPEGARILPANGKAEVTQISRSSPFAMIRQDRLSFRYMRCRISFHHLLPWLYRGLLSSASPGSTF
jgi:hypothetical protein